MNFCFFYSFIIFTLVISNLSNKNKIKGGTLKNIYNQQLQPCGNSNMEYGSWDNNYKCSELDGGVHQICIKNMKKMFLISHQKLVNLIGLTIKKKIIITVCLFRSMVII